MDVRIHHLGKNRNFGISFAFARSSLLSLFNFLTCICVLVSSTSYRLKIKFSHRFSFTSLDSKRSVGRLSNRWHVSRRSSCFPATLELERALISFHHIRVLSILVPCRSKYCKLMCSSCDGGSYGGCSYQSRVMRTSIDWSKESSEAIVADIFEKLRIIRSRLAPVGNGRVPDRLLDVVKVVLCQLEGFKNMDQ